MKLIGSRAALKLILVVVLPASALAQSHTEPSAQKRAVNVKRAEIRVSANDRRKLKDLSQSLRMVELTPIVNAHDEVLCLELSKINDRLITDRLKAEVGDCISEITAFKKGPSGKVETERVPLLSPSDAFMVYQKLAGATRIEVDLKRAKRVVPLAYILD